MASRERSPVISRAALQCRVKWTREWIGGGRREEEMLRASGLSGASRRLASRCNRIRISVRRR